MLGSIRARNGLKIRVSLVRPRAWAPYLEAFVARLLSSAMAQETSQAAGISPSAPSRRPTERPRVGVGTCETSRVRGGQHGTGGIRRGRLSWEGVRRACRRAQPSPQTPPWRARGVLGSGTWGAPGNKRSAVSRGVPERAPARAIPQTRMPLALRSITPADLDPQVDPGGGPPAWDAADSPAHVAPALRYAHWYQGPVHPG